MSISKLALALDTVSIKRVNGGDEWVNQMNSSIGSLVYNRDMSGNDIMDIYIKLSPTQKDVCDLAVKLPEGKYSALIDELLRIKESDRMPGLDKHEITINVVSVSLTFMFILISVTTASVMAAYMSATEELPNSRVLSVISSIGQWLLDSGIFAK